MIYNGKMYTQFAKMPVSVSNIYPKDFLFFTLK